MNTAERSRTIVFASFESEFAPCGGLSAVMKFLPREMAKAERTLLITPFFPRIERCFTAYTERNTIRSTGITITVKYGKKEHSVDILKYSEKINGLPYRIYFISSKKFFNAPENPYVNPSRPEKLFEDSLFFSAAVPRVLASIPEEAPFILHLQDWETACIVGTMPRIIQHKCFLTLHNPYDHRLTLEDMERINLNPGSAESGTSVLNYALNRVSGVSTVSSVFAEELTSDPLHAKVFIPHLQGILSRNPVKGIENGNFLIQRFSSKTTVKDLLEAKKTGRKRLITILESDTGQRMIKRSWGNCDLSDYRIPVFLMFGRDDPRQKGYDIAALAVQELLEENGSDYGRFIFTPIPGQKGDASLDFLKTLAENNRKAVAVFPFRMEVGYSELQQSATYLLMPSLYEPFGGATEGYSNGVPVVARATGGLIQQIDPHNMKDLPEEVKKLIVRFNGTLRKSSGFLFKEKTVSDPISDWKEMIKAGFLDQDPIGDPVAERKGIELFRAMVDSAKQAIRDAIKLYSADSAAYGQMCINGLRILEKFSWESAVRKYRNSLYTGK